LERDSTRRGEKEKRKKGASHQKQAIWPLLSLQSSGIVRPPRLSRLLIAGEATLCLIDRTRLKPVIEGTGDRWIA